MSQVVNPPRIGFTDADPCAGRVVYAPLKSLWIGGMTLAALIGGAATFSWDALLLFLGSTATVLLLGHSVGMHRKLIHNSFECPLWLEHFLVYCGVMVGLAGPHGIVRTHDLRDWAQRQSKCHPYLSDAGGALRDAFWQLHCDIKLDHPPVLMLERRIANDRFYRWLQRTWMLQHLPVALLLFWWGGWAYVFWGACARVAVGVTGHWLIGYLAHNFGGRTYHVEGAAAQGYNVRFAGLITMGESWHNNHHAFPGSARIGLFKGEVDPGWWLLKTLEAMGLVWNLKLPEDLPYRPELKRLRPVGNPLSADAPFPPKGAAGDRPMRYAVIPRKAWTTVAYVTFYLLPFTLLFILAATTVFGSWPLLPFTLAYGAPLAALWLAALHYPRFTKGVAPFSPRSFKGRVLLGLLACGVAADVLSLAAPLFRLFISHDRGYLSILPVIGIAGLPAAIFSTGVLLKIWKERNSPVFAPV